MIITDETEQGGRFLPRNTPSFLVLSGAPLRHSKLPAGILLRRRSDGFSSDRVNIAIVTILILHQAARNDLHFVSWLWGRW